MALALAKIKNGLFFDKVGWQNWCNKFSALAVEKTEESPAEEATVAVEPVEPAPQPVVPCSGKLEFECPAQLLGNRMVNILISWDTVGGGNND